MCDVKENKPVTVTLRGTNEVATFTLKVLTEAENSSLRLLCYEKTTYKVDRPYTRLRCYKSPELLPLWAFSAETYCMKGTTKKTSSQVIQPTSETCIVPCGHKPPVSCCMFYAKCQHAVPPCFA